MMQSVKIGFIVSLRVLEPQSLQKDDVIIESFKKEMEDLWGFMRIPHFRQQWLLATFGDPLPMMRPADALLALLPAAWGSPSAQLRDVGGWIQLHANGLDIYRDSHNEYHIGIVSTILPLSLWLCSAADHADSLPFSPQDASSQTVNYIPKQSKTQSLACICI